MNWEYYEYADDLIARMVPNSGGQFQVWVKDQWVPSLDMVRFSDTAQKIDNIGEFKKMHPEFKKALSDAVEPEMNDRIEKAAAIAE